MIARDITRVSLLIAALSCGFAGRARAAPELTVTWPKLAGCPDRAALERRVEQQLGRKLGDAAEPLAVEAAIAVGAHDYTLSLRTSRANERGQRTLKATSCPELADAAALVIALSLHAARASEPPAEPEPSATTASELTRFSVLGAALLESGFLPRVGAGGELTLALSRRRSHAELTGLWLPAVRSAPGDDGGRVDVMLWATRAGYCHDAVGQRARLAGCAGLELGRASGEGHELMRRDSRAFLWVAGWLSLRLGLRLHPRLALVLAPGLAIPFRRRQFVSVDAQGNRVARLHTPANYSVRATLGLELFF